MGLVKKILVVVFSLFLATVATLYVWFWASPVGVNNYINKVSLQILLDSPELLTSLGIIDNSVLDFHSDKLDRYDKASDEAMLDLLYKSREGLNAYGPEGLDGQELLSWKIVAWFFDDLIRQSEFDYGSYRVNQISGVMVNMPQFLTDRHQIVDQRSAQRYLSRLTEFARVIEEVRIRVLDDRDNGTVPPDFIIQGALNGMRQFVDGGASTNPLVTTLQDRLEKVASIDEKRALEITQQASNLVDIKILPQYAEMIAVFEELLKETDHSAGIWRLPQGDKIYESALRSNNSTTLSADEIHQLGLQEVARIEIEMDKILADQGLSKGPLVDRIRHLMTLPEHNWPNTDEGREQQIVYLNEVNDEIMSMVEDYFITIPPQPLEILRVPEYAQDSAPGGYYQPPSS